jgi:hypothetical protein
VAPGLRRPRLGVRDFDGDADTSIDSTFRIDCRDGHTGERDGNFGQSPDVYGDGDERE